MSALTGDIRYAADSAVADLSFQTDIPLLHVRQMIRVSGTVGRATASVVRCSADIWSLVVGRESVVKVERGFISGERIAEAELRVEAVERHAAAPSGVECLREENTVPGPHHHLAAQFVGQTE